MAGIHHVLSKTSQVSDRILKVMRIFPAPVQLLDNWKLLNASLIEIPYLFKKYFMIDSRLSGSIELVSNDSRETQCLVPVEKSILHELAEIP